MAEAESSSKMRSRWRRPRTLILVAIGVVALFAGLLSLADRWIARAAHDQVRREAAEGGLVNAGLLSSELQKYRLLPLVLADYPDVTNALAAPSSGSTAQLDRTLELLADRTDAAVIYVIDRNGRTIAASNWRRRDSFVGQMYGFRRYFWRSMRAGSAEQFALGTVSHRPGLFLARRIANGLGVIVVKVEFDQLENSWSHQIGSTLVLDGNGVVIISSRRDWRLRATRPLDPAIVRTLLSARTYGDTMPPPLQPLLRLPLVDDALVTDPHSNIQYLVATEAVPVPGWTLYALEPMDQARRAAAAQARVAALGIALVLLLAAGLWWRERERRVLARAARAALEEEVRNRTAELRNANEQLQIESEERARNEARFREAREELAQASRLGTLGQITAGVAHEVNQPVAAIRTFAENGNVMLDRGDVPGARRNLGLIVELTQRIGQITAELRLFARREHVQGPVMIAEALDGALLLTGDRLRHAGVAIDRGGDHRDFVVTADRVRLEQVLINLLQNAADALDGRPDPRITIRTRATRGGYEILVADNGPGIPEHLRGRLFTPFVTSKAAGLGLGLVIARDIIREFGGQLAEAANPGGGAAFTIKLKKN